MRNVTKTVVRSHGRNMNEMIFLEINRGELTKLKKKGEGNVSFRLVSNLCQHRCDGFIFVNQM
jgi:hypothetical protein